jgi:VIT1/CCC1 family predicted Fe2+/Mn2+ transporter
MLELFLELLLEIGVQIFGELLVELVLRPLAATFEKRPNPVTAAFGYAMLGGIVGGLSLLLMPNHWLQNPGAQIANLIVSPIVAGIAMAIVGRWRESRGQELIRLDRFSYGYLFAFVSTLVRYVFAG